MDIKVTKIKIIADEHAPIRIKAKLEKDHKKKWVERILEIGNGHTDATVSDYFFGEASIGLSIANQNQIEQAVFLPIHILCEPAKGKGTSRVGVWGEGFDVRQVSDMKSFVVMRGTVRFDWKQ